MSRPNLFTQEIADKICARISDGESLRKICDNPEMPGRRTVHEWLAKFDDFADQYALAHERQAEHFVSQIVEMADAATRDNWQVVKMQIWARQWAASKLHPKKYGDQLPTETNSGGTLVITWGGGERIGELKTIEHESGPLLLAPEG